MSGTWELCAGLGCPNVASSSGPLCRKCHKAELAKGGYRPPAAGPWHKWPDSAPPTAKGCYLVRTANGGMDALLWVPGCPEFWMDDPPVTHWAEILPPSEP